MTCLEVVACLKEQYEVTVHPQTVYGWQRRGKKGVLLEKDPTEAQVNAFIAKTGTQFSRGRPRVEDVADSVVSESTPQA